MATAAEQQSEAKLRYKVTLVIKASKVEAVAKWTKDAFGDVVVEKVEKVAAFVSGEWSQAVYGEDYIDEKQGKPKMGEWVNTDGRTIHEYTKTGGWVEPEGGGTKVYKKFKKPVTTYVVRDEFGAVDEAKTWEEAQRLYRAPVSESEALEMADHIARMIVKSDTYAPHAVEEAQEYLTARRIKVEPEELESEDARRKPTYFVTFTIEAGKFSAVEKKAKEVFGDQLHTVTKEVRGMSRGAELGHAESLVDEAKEIVSTLKEDIENWRDGMSGTNLENSEKFSMLEECASGLESLESDVEGINFDNIEFPGMFS